MSTLTLSSSTPARPSVGRIVHVRRLSGGDWLISPAIVTRVDADGSIDAVLFLSSFEWAGAFSSFKPTMGMMRVHHSSTEGQGPNAPSWFWPPREP